MGWRFDKKGDKYRVWSTVVDDYLTDWLDRKEVLAFIYQDRLHSFKEGIIELYMAFPDKRGQMEGNKIYIDQERRKVHSDWIRQLIDLKSEKYDQEIDRLFREALEFMGYVVDSLQPIPEASIEIEGNKIKAWYKETLKYYDGISLLSTLHGETEGEYYLSMLVNMPSHELYLCIPISREKIEEYKNKDWDIYLQEYKKSDKFYTMAYEDFDGDTYILREISRDDVKDEWWPGEVKNENNIHSQDVQSS